MFSRQCYSSGKIVSGEYEGLIGKIYFQFISHNS
jgi:hypothetical protein